MEREIKFRGLRTDGKGWVYGNIQIPKPPFDRYFMWEDENNQVEVTPESVGQFTGKKINGIDLYDGDKIEMQKRIDTVKIVKYCEKTMAFKLANEDFLKNERTVRIMGDSIWETPNLSWWETFEDEMVIIGNIHQDKNLLK